MLERKMCLVTPGTRSIYPSYYLVLICMPSKNLQHSQVLALDFPMTYIKRVGSAMSALCAAVTRIRTWVASATTKSTNHYTITAFELWIEACSSFLNSNLLRTYAFAAFGRARPSYLPPFLLTSFPPSLRQMPRWVTQASARRARQMPSHAHVIFLYRNVQQVAKRAIIT